MELAALFSVASVLFGWHAGGGFATGNQANQFYIVSGWLGPISAVGAILLLTLTIRQAIIMYNQRGLSSYKELFETLYHPFGKLEIAFEVYYYIMVLMATSSSIAGAGILFQDIAGISYGVSIVLIGILLMFLTMFGADLVRKASSVMSILIMVCALSIYIYGIATRPEGIASVYGGKLELALLPQAALKSFQYAGFQCAAIPTMIACGTVLAGSKQVSRSMWISFVMNAVALCLSVFMLLGWKDVYTAIEGGATIPTLTIAKIFGVDAFIWAYYICLFLCFVSTGVSAVFGVVNRFEKAGLVKKRIPNDTGRRAAAGILVMGVSMLISLAGLTNIIKYGYGYCGYVGIAIIIVPFLTVGVYKNRKYAAEQIRAQSVANASPDAGEEAPAL